MSLSTGDHFDLQSILTTSHFSTEKSKALVWSGPGNRERAEALRQEGYKTIEDTQGGKALNQALPYEAVLRGEISKDEYREYWRQASHEFSLAQEGNITTCVIGALEERDFRAVEFPNLVADRKVSSINGVSREELYDVYQNEPSAAFERICVVERGRAAVDRPLERETKAQISEPELEAARMEPRELADLSAGASRATDKLISGALEVAGQATEKLADLVEGIFAPAAPAPSPAPTPVFLAEPEPERRPPQEPRELSLEEERELVQRGAKSLRDVRMEELRAMLQREQEAANRRERANDGGREILFE
jgi:hypothetical protein